MNGGKDEVAVNEEEGGMYAGVMADVEEVEEGGGGSMSADDEAIVFPASPTLPAINIPLLIPPIP